MSTNETYCGVTLLKIGEYYSKNISGYIDLPICSIGAIFNLFNLLVFTRKNMISPVNLIFTHIAFTDLVVLLGAIPFSGILNFKRSGNFEKGWTYEETLVYVFFNDWLTTFHLISVYLTVQLAIWRYMAIAHPLRERQWCNLKTTRNVIIFGYILSVFLSIPMYLARGIETVQSSSDTSSEATYRQRYTDNPMMFLVSFFTYGMLGTLLPTGALAVFTLSLIVTLLAKSYRRRSAPSPNIAFSVRNHKIKQLDRSVTILLIVLVLFLTAEVPRGSLFIMNIFYDIRYSQIHYKCYNSLLLIPISVVYINTSITFLVYYTMSQQFRITFKSLFNGNKKVLLSKQNTVSSLRYARRIDQSFANTETDQCIEYI